MLQARKTSTPFWKINRGGSNSFSLDGDISAVEAVRIINEELHIMLQVVKKQIEVLKDGKHSSRKDPTWAKQLTSYKETLETLSDETVSINEMVS
jgi:hypothetical protein